MIRLPARLRQLAEPDIERFLPYAGHIRPNICALFGGAMLAMFRVRRPAPFELEAVRRRNGREDRLNTLLRAIADPELSIIFHLCHHEKTLPAPQPHNADEFGGPLLESYQRTALSRLFVNDWFISLLSHPTGGKKRRLNPRTIARTVLKGADAETLTLSDEREQTIEDVCRLLQDTLSEYELERLGLTEAYLTTPDANLYDEDEAPITVPVTEMGTALNLIRTGHERLIPHTAGALYASIYTDPCVFRRNHFEPNIPGVPRVGAMIGWQNYPARPSVGMFNSLLQADYPFVMTHDFRYRATGAAIASLALTRRQMQAAGDAATDLIEGLRDAENRTGSVKAAPGLHNFALAVYGETKIRLNHNVADATKRLQEYGAAAPRRERNVWNDGALPQSYWLQMPGSRGFKPRPGKIDTRDLVDFASLDGYPVGRRDGYWGPSAIRFKTNGYTAYDFDTHDDDVGHRLYIGRSGSGKSVEGDLEMHAVGPLMGSDGIRLVIDKDQSHRPGIERAGGIYRQLRRNMPSGLAPLKAYKDTPRTRAFLFRLYTTCIMLDGRRPLTAFEDRRLVRAIARQLAMPPDLRSMGGIREYLGYQDAENGAGARFEPYCKGGSKGWLLDNDAHVIEFSNLGGLYGIDFTDLLPSTELTDDHACPIAAAVIIHQLRERTDGRRIWTLFEECRFYIEALGAWIDDLALTGRKSEISVGAVFQQPEHVFIDPKLGASIVAQMRTKFIWPGENYDHTALKRLGLSAAAVRMLTTDMTIGKARRFLLWRGRSDSVVCEFDLTGMEELKWLSYRARDARAGVYEQLLQEAA